MFARAFGIFCCFCFSTAAAGAVAVATACFCCGCLCCCCCCCCCCYCTTYCWLVLLGVFYFFFQLSCESHMVMDVVQNSQKSSGYDQGPTMRKNMWVVTPRCAAAVVVSAVVLRTAGIDVAPHYHQLLVSRGFQLSIWLLFYQKKKKWRHRWYTSVHLDAGSWKHPCEGASCSQYYCSSSSSSSSVVPQVCIYGYV